MSDPSPSETVLATNRSLELFPEPSEKHFARVVSVLQVEASPALQVLVLLRDVRDPAHPIEARRGWLARARELARTLVVQQWFEVFLALVRHAVIVDDKPGARDLAVRLIDSMYAQPPRPILDQSSRYRDAMFRALQALRVAILARTIGLELPDVVPKIVDLALDDRTLDTRSRERLVPQIAAAVAHLETDDTLLAQLGGRPAPIPQRGKKRKLAPALGAFKAELAPKYIADAVFEWNRPPVAFCPE